MRTAGLISIVALLTFGAAAGGSWPAVARRPSEADRPNDAAGVVQPLGSPAAPGTSRAELARTVSEMEARVAAVPRDAAAAVRLADALLRQSRALGNGGLATRAERVLLRALADDPDRYDARRMLAASLQSQHRFREAIREAERCLQIRRDDAWPWGVIGDGHLELGNYDEAFAAFDRMVSIRPDAASYARVSYARELQGDMDAALRLMKMALESTSPNDPESRAWHHVQLGGLELARNRVDTARREYAHALHIFPDHPMALEGLARVAFARGRTSEALSLLDSAIAHAPTPAALALSAQVLRAGGRAAEADRRDALAEAAWRADAPDPAALALFLADRNRQLGEAVRLAESAARERRDIFTADALAWVYYRAGRLADASAASALALRTGTRDKTIRGHATTIAAALGDTK
jgi:tetratricopeptide (TPR) repeat protein